MFVFVFVTKVNWENWFIIVITDLWERSKNSDGGYLAKVPSNTCLRFRFNCTAIVDKLFQVHAVLLVHSLLVHSFISA